jgi:hypothetical protein
VIKKPPGAPSAQKQIDTFAAKYLPAIARQFKAANATMRKRLPGAYAMAYDNWNGLVIGYSPTARPSDAIFSILAQPDHITLCFLQGVHLVDPKKLLRGEGNQVRSVRLVDGLSLDTPAVKALMAQALEDDENARMLDAANVAPKDRLVVRSVSAKQRPRRP